MSNWEALKLVLTTDLEAWVNEKNSMQLEYNTEMDLGKRGALQGAISLLSVYQSILEHYLGVMEDLEKEGDGGEEPRQVAS